MSEALQLKSLFDSSILFKSCSKVFYLARFKTSIISAKWISASFTKAVPFVSPGHYWLSF